MRVKILDPAQKPLFDTERQEAEGGALLWSWAAGQSFGVGAGASWTRPLSFVVDITSALMDMML